MITLISLFIFETIVYLFLGLYALISNPKEETNQLFALTSLTVLTMSFSGIMVQIAPNEPVAQIWYKIGAIGFASYTYSVLLFCLKLTNLFKINKIYYIILFLPLAYFIIQIISIPQIVILTKYNNTWMMNSVFVKFPFLLYSNILYQFIYLTLSIMLLVFWYKKAESSNQKKQALIILITLFLSLMFSVFDQLIFFHIFHLFDFSVPGFFSIYFLIWAFGIFYTIIRYRFLSNPDNNE